MVHNFVKLSCSKETKDIILDHCLKLYRKHHPEHDHIPISQDKILYEIAIYYLK